MLHSKLHETRSLHDLSVIASYYHQALGSQDLGPAPDQIMDDLLCVWSDWKKFSAYARQFGAEPPMDRHQVSFKMLTLRDYTAMRDLSHALMNGVSTLQGSTEHLVGSIIVNRHHYIIASQIHQQTRSNLSSSPSRVLIARQCLSVAIHNLANCLIRRYDRSGMVEDIDDAVKLRRETLQLEPMDLPSRVDSLNGLAGALMFRFYALSNMDDLDEMIEVSRNCVVVASGGQAALAHHYLASALFLRAERVYSKEDLSESIDNSRQALKLCSEEGGAYRQMLNQLSASLRTRFSLDNKPDDLREANECHQRALALIGPHHPERGTLLANLSAGYHMLFLSSHETKDIEHSLRLKMEALDCFHDGHGQQSECLWGIAVLYSLPKAPFYDMHKSLQFLKESIDDERTSAAVRLHNAIKYLSRTTLPTDCEEDLQLKQLEIMEATVRLLPRVANFSLDAVARLRVLRSADRSAVITASLALSLGKPELALEIAEEGRGIFWTQGLRLRAQLDDVPIDLKNSLLESAKQLESDSLTKADNDEEAARRRRAAVQYSALVEKVRALPGLERFMLGPTAASLAKAAEQGPVVLLIGVGSTCTAILITYDAIRQLPLRTTEDALKKLCVSWQQASSRSRQLQQDPGEVGEIEDAEDPEESSKSTTSETRSAKRLHRTAIKTDAGASILRTLWEDVVSVVIEALDLKVCTKCFQRL